MVAMTLRSTCCSYFARALSLSLSLSCCALTTDNRKAAGHELKALNALISCGVRSLHFPYVINSPPPKKGPIQIINTSFFFQPHGVGELSGLPSDCYFEGTKPALLLCSDSLVLVANQCLDTEIWVCWWRPHDSNTSRAWGLHEKGSNDSCMSLFFF